MKFYTEQVNKELAYTLKEKGMPLILTTECLDSICIEESTNYAWSGKKLEDVATYNTIKYYALPTYADVFDWLLNNDYNITVHHVEDKLFRAMNDNSFAIHTAETWVDCANKAIKYVLEQL